MRKDVTELWKLAEPYVKDAGLDLVELQWNREPEGWVLRLFIDRAWQPDAMPHLPGEAANGAAAAELLPPASVTFEDCERVSRDVSAALDVANLISHAYRLEVGSPGIDRPLRRETDFKRFAGLKAKIRTEDAVEGRRNFSGTLRDAHDGFVEIDCDGRSYQVPVATVAKANLIPDWSAEFKRAERSAS